MSAFSAFFQKLRFLASVCSKITQIRWLILTECVSPAERVQQADRGTLLVKNSRPVLGVKRHFGSARFKNALACLFLSCLSAWSQKRSIAGPSAARGT
jgi:hypothetical protein